MRIPRRFTKEHLRWRLVRRLVGDRPVVANVRVSGAYGADLVNMAGFGACFVWGVTAEATPKPPPTIQRLDAPRQQVVWSNNCYFSNGNRFGTWQA